VVAITFAIAYGYKGRPSVTMQNIGPTFLLTITGSLLSYRRHQSIMLHIRGLFWNRNETDIWHSPVPENTHVEHCGVVAAITDLRMRQSYILN
jgi:hypothetical protein